MKANSILETIGQTPHVSLSRLFPSGPEVWIKLEKFNPGGSIKDRIALAMIEDAERKGILVPGCVIIEPTSGNTGIGLAMVCAVKGYRLILVMPESMTPERRKLMEVYGAQFELTPREGGMRAAIARAMELKVEISNAWMPSQFDNPANPQIHEQTTALEILNDFPDGFDYLITGVGTGGHISGVARIIKSRFPKLKVFAVEPEASPVISGGNPGPHQIQGIGAGFIPKNLEISLLDGVITVTKEEAFSMVKELARKEGIFAGISTGSTLAAVNKKRLEISPVSSILCFNYDTGERYLSVESLWNTP